MRNISLLKSARVARVLLGLIIGVVAVGGATSASAQAQPIIGCWNMWTSNLRVIHPLQNCNANETRLEFASSADAQDLQDQIDALDGRVSDLETRMGTAEGDIDALEGRMTTAEGDITALDGRLTTAEGDITALEGRMTTAEGNITTLQSDLTTLDSRVTTIRNFFTGVADGIIGCFTAQNATFSITIPEIVFPEWSTDLGGLLQNPITIIPEFTLVPEIVIGFPVFNATTVVGCLNGITTSTSS